MRAAAPAAAVSATIIFSIALYEVKTLWFNEKMAHHTATNTIMGHPGKNEFRLLRSWDSGPPLKIDALNQARLVMTEISKLRVMPLVGLEKGRIYQIRVRAVCQDKNALIFNPAECFLVVVKKIFRYLNDFFLQPLIPQFHHSGNFMGSGENRLAHCGLYLLSILKRLRQASWK